MVPVRFSFQLQALRERSVIQLIGPSPRPPGPIELLTDWAKIRAGRPGPYPEKLYAFLFEPRSPYRPAGEELAGATLALRLNPTASPATLAELLQSDSLDADETLLDWIQDLPWEALLLAFWQRLDPQTPFGDWLQHQRSVSIVREPWLTQTRPITPLSGGLMTVLVAWAQPAAMPNLRPEPQAAHIGEMVRRLNEHDGLPLEILDVIENATASRLCQAIAEAVNPIHVVHIVAHGAVGEDGLGRLLFASEHGERETQEHVGRLVEALETHFARHNTVPALFILNSCLSAATAGFRPEASLASSIAQTGIPYIVANQAGIRVSEMLVFTEAFYRALGARLPVDRAMLLARQALLQMETDPLHPTHRQLAPALELAQQFQSPILDIQGGLPGWIVPVLYMRPDMDGYLPGWKPAARIVWPLDGKVMVLIGDGVDSFYIDECPVTEAQYQQARHQPVAPVSFDSLDLQQVRAKDNGLPKVQIAPPEASKHAARVLKHLPTPEQWLWIARMDSNYAESGRYCGPRSGPEFCNAELGQRSDVRAYTQPQHQCGLWDFVGNTYEVVARERPGAAEYYRVSSSHMVKMPEAFHNRVDETRLADSFVHTQIGFRTVARWQDVYRLAREWQLSVLAC